MSYLFDDNLFVVTDKQSLGRSDNALSLQVVYITLVLDIGICHADSCGISRSKEVAAC
jgi:hypothetical protein